MTDTVRISIRIYFFMAGRLCSFSALISFCNRVAQTELMRKIRCLDAELQIHLHIRPSFRRFNIEFTILSTIITVYFAGFFSFQMLRNQDDTYTIMYYACCYFADWYFSIYLVYMVYWVRILLDRSSHLVEAFETIFVATRISEHSLTVCMDLLKLVFSIRDNIQLAFGSILLIEIPLYALQIAVSLYAVIHYQIEMAWVTTTKPSATFYLSYCLLHWSQLVYVIGFYAKIGDIVVQLQRIVSRTRIEYGRRVSNYLDLFTLYLQHHAETKYVTANGFFPINYSTLNSVSKRVGWCSS